MEFRRVLFLSVRHDDAITGWPALTQGPHSIIIVSIETRWECDMADLFENPLGLDGFEFVEFSAPEKGILEPVFEAMGFTLIARHRSKDVQLWSQGGINQIGRASWRERGGQYG